MALRSRVLQTMVRPSEDWLAMHSLFQTRRRDGGRLLVLDLLDQPALRRLQHRRHPTPVPQLLKDVPGRFGQ